MSHMLEPHPEFLCKAVRFIAVEVSRGALFSIRYVMKGNVARLELGEPRAPGRADELWKGTCFEAFLRLPESDDYLEFNFAPSRQWAAYSFERYREGMHDVPIPEPAIGTILNKGDLSLQVDLDLQGAEKLRPDSIWQLGLSAVIEETNGCKSYWALTHPPGKPDFHHPDCFAMELPPP